MVDAGEPTGPEIIAGEYALGVLEGEELATAQRLFLSDRHFAELVDWWRYHLARMAEAAGEYEPSADVWPAIARQLGTQTDGQAAPAELQRPQARGLSGWNLGAAMAGVAAIAAVATYTLTRPSGEMPTPVETLAPAPAAGDRLIAQLGSEDGALSLSGLVDAQASRISLAIAGFAPGIGEAPELWVVPAGGAPQSLGRIPESGSFSRTLTQEERGLLVPGASLAVTYEDSGSIPNTAPTTDILLLGGLTEV